MFQVALFAAALLIPAGTWNWPRAIQFLGAYGVVLVSIVVLGLIAPSSLEARVQVPTSKSQPRSDRIVSAFLFTAIFAWPIFIPVDVFRLHLT
ncbi:MAG: hypothetical protein JSU89_03655, partial [Myxococcales bacterium]